jgi:hypothetical protein
MQLAFIEMQVILLLVSKSLLNIECNIIEVTHGQNYNIHQYLMFHNLSVPCGLPAISTSPSVALYAQILIFPLIRFNSSGVCSREANLYAIETSKAFLERNVFAAEIMKSEFVIYAIISSWVMKPYMY